MTQRVETDSFALWPHANLPTDLPPGTPEGDLVTIMTDCGMPRDPRTWQHWPDVFFPTIPRLPNGWTRMWDETARRIVCYRSTIATLHRLRPPHARQGHADPPGAQG